MEFEHPFYFLRHGETQWNKEHKTQGQLDSQLNAKGVGQANQAAEILQNEPIERIISSPLSRARHTAEAVARHHNLEVQFDDDLMECHLGDHQGGPHGPWLAEYFNGNYAPPNGELFKDFCERVWKAMHRSVALGPNTLIVAHGGLWVAAQKFASVQPLIKPMPNALPVKVNPQGQNWNCTVLYDY